MKLRDNGGPAFPSVVELMEGGDTHKEHFYGISARDYFAAQALAGMSGWGHQLPFSDYGDVAKRCYMLADAMLETRKS